MQENFLARPEILEIYGTYKIVKIKHVLILFNVIDSNGKTEIISAILMKHEDSSRWLINELKNNNLQACEKMHYG